MSPYDRLYVAPPPLHASRGVPAVRRSLVLAVILAFFLTAMVSCGTAVTVRAAGDECATSRTLASGSTQRTIDSGGRNRSYLLHVPPGYDGSVRTPLVVLFHGLAGDPATMMDTTNMASMADDKNAILVAPQGLGSTSHWNFRAPISDPDSDLAFVRDLVSSIKKEACVDSSRVYAVGFSNGSALTLALACDGTTKFAAYGAVSAPFYDDSCGDAPPAAIIYFHGMNDSVVPFGGATTLIGPLPPVHQVMADWASHDGCPALGASTTVSEHVRHFSWTGCQDRTGVDVYAVGNGGHRWPGGEKAAPGRVSGVMTQEIDASMLIWQFFDRHPTGGQ